MSLGAPGASVRAYLWTVYCLAMRGSDFLALFKSVLAILSENISNFLFMAGKRAVNWVTLLWKLRKNSQKTCFLGKSSFSAKGKIKCLELAKPRGSSMSTQDFSLITLIRLFCSFGIQTGALRENFSLFSGPE